MSYKTAIHDLLVTTAFTGTYTEAIYSETMPSLLTEGDLLTPSSVEANEIRGVFGIDADYGRELRQEREGWAWLLIVRFDTEAIMEDFESALLRAPLVVPRDPGNGVDTQVTLLLEASEYEHPPRGGASNGTLVRYRFLAEVCRQ